MRKLFFSFFIEKVPQHIYSKQCFFISAVYNLQGQRVTKATKGVFIQNGKKVIKK